MSLSIEEKREKNRERAKAWYWANHERALAQAGAYYEANREASNARSKAWAAANPERSKQRLKEFAERHPNYSSNYHKAYYAKNRGELLAQSRANAKTPEAAEKRRVRKRERYQTDVVFRLQVILRTRVKNALNGSAKHGSGVRLLGCSVEELKAYLETMFLQGMTWENYGGLWVIDHIKPLAKFDLTKPEQLAEACNWMNLRPLWAKANLQKGSRYVEPEPFYD
jgi:hypothetical protein